MYPVGGVAVIETDVPTVYSPEGHPPLLVGLAVCVPDPERLRG